jgi:hypothetical protein
MGREKNRIKQLAIVSGKGGTGKRTIAAAFTALAKNKVMVDCGVEGPQGSVVRFRLPSPGSMLAYTCGGVAKIVRSMWEEVQRVLAAPFA